MKTGATLLTQRKMICYSLLGVCLLGWGGWGCPQPSSAPKRTSSPDKVEQTSPRLAALSSSFGAGPTLVPRTAPAFDVGARPVPRSSPGHRVAFGAKAMFPFLADLEGWKGWGDCEGRYQASLGHQHPGSLYLSCLGSSQSYTFYRHIRGLQPGRYQVSAWLRGLDIQPGTDDESVWVFADGGKGTQSPTKNLQGTFSWSQLVYTIDVTGTTLTLWFRLKSQGQLWVDDVDVQRHQGKPISLQWKPSHQPLPTSEPVGQGMVCPRCYRWWKPFHHHCAVCGENTVRVTSSTMFAKSPQAAVQKSSADSRQHGSLGRQRVLLDFEVSRLAEEQSFHALREYRNRATSGSRAAVLRYGVYNNFRMGDSSFSNWSGYRFLALDVYNPLPQHVPFHLCVNDRPHADYWDQLNHLARLAPGWNRLRFPLQRYVGERGSVRFQRYVDLSRIRRFWFAVAPEQKPRADVEFLVDFVRLEQGPPAPQTFPQLYRFDFVAQPLHTQPGFWGVTPQHVYRRETGFGFQNLKVWRLLDSQYADTLLRDAILSKEGAFVLDVPNGTYEIHLYAQHVGLWYEHFWKQQQISIQGKPWVRRQRRHARDYLQDLLRFQDVEPTPTDHAYDLYLRPLLSPHHTTVRVTEGQIVIRWKSDGSGIPLNALVVYPTSQRTKGQAFLEQCYQQQRDEFSQISRKLEPLARVDKNAIQVKDKKRGWYAALLQPSDYPRYNWIVRSQGEQIQLAGGWGQRPMQALLVRRLHQTPASLRIQVSKLRSKQGHTISAEQILVRYGVSQFIGHEINHETYELAPRWLRPVPARGLKLLGQHSTLIWLQVPLQPVMKAGVYRGVVTLEMNQKQIQYPIQLTVHPFTLPSVDMPIGYFGLDPVPFDFFDAPGVQEQRQTWRKQVLQILQERGFSTWSSLPKVRITRRHGRLTAQTNELSELLSMAVRLGLQQPIFSYGGGFLDDLLQIDQQHDILEFSQAEYRKQSAALLRALLRKHRKIPFIYTFTDEASGYSQKVERDLQRAKRLKQHYPFLRTGGFSHSLKPGAYGDDLNHTMTDISLSSVSKKHADTLKQQGRRWGFYNAAIGPFEVGRSTFGEGLFAARYHGASHRLAWHLTGMQNYPYYDLDGRESDAMMLYPRTDGQLFVALKMEWATQGLEDYRLLLLLEQLAQQAGTRGRTALLWIARHYKEVDFFATPNYLQVSESRRTDAHSQAFRKTVYRYILQLLPRSD